MSEDKYKKALEDILKEIDETCWDYVGVDVIYFLNNIKEIINKVLSI